MHIAAFTLARLPRQTRNIGAIFSRSQVFEDAFNLGHIAEFMHSLRATAEFARRLRPAQQQCGHDSDFRRREFQIAEFRVAEALFILGHPIAETADRTQIMALD